MICFRADGNSKIGLGHVMRTLSIADACREAGEEVFYITADDHAFSLLTDRGYDVCVLGTDYRKPMDEMPFLKAVLKERAPDYFFADSYFLNAEYFRQLSGMVITICMDDLLETVYPADFLINYNIYAPFIGYEKYYAQEKTKCLLGSAYAPLRRDFLAAVSSEEKKENVRDILVLTGGADTYGIAASYANAVVKTVCREMEDLTLHIVCGSFQSSREQLIKLSEEYPQIKVHENVTRMADLMRSCDLAVSAAGSTLYELCATGVPAVIFTLAPNQIRAAEYFEKETGMINAGSYPDHPTKCLDAMIAGTVSLINSGRLRKTIRTNMMQVTDGRGAERIVQWIRKYGKNTV